MGRIAAIRFFATMTCVLLLGMVGGCVARSDDEIVVYAAHDSVFSEPILQQFEKQTGIPVRPKFDVESTKTVGLTTAIMAEANRPVCDVFWNNEILNTLRLKRQGLLETFQPKMAESYPAAFKDPDGAWYGFAARARILVVNTRIVPPDERPSSIHDLADPQWKGKVGIAKPLFGTTASHAACLFSVWGDEKAKAFFQKLKDNDIQIMSGNKQVAIAAARGQISFGLTDTDDALVMIDQAHPVEIIYPDRNPDELGTLFIPNTVCIIKGSPHPAEAEQFVNYLLSPEVETRLAKGPAGQIPLNPQVSVETRVETPATVKAMEVDFSAAVEKWDEAAKFIEREFTAP